MPGSPTVTIRLGSFHAIFVKAVAGHLADMRQALRAVEDGSFVERATAPAPGTIIQMRFEHDVLEDAAFRHTRRCFRSIISDFFTFVDQVLGAQQLLEQGLKVPPGGLSDAKAVLAFVQTALDEHIRTVTGNTTLRNPDKVKLLVEAGAISKDSARIVGSYTGVRRILEHFRGVPPEPTVIFFRKVKFFLGETEIVSLPAEGKEGESLYMRSVEEKRILPSGEKVRLTEAEIDGIALALQVIADEVTQVLSRAKGQASRTASTV